MSLSPRPYTRSSMAWEQDFDAYLTYLDESLASFIVDLAAAAHAPCPPYDHRVQVRVVMQHPREDGLRDRREADALGQFEDALVELLEHRCGALFVGHMICEGELHVVCYAEGRRIEDQAALLEGLDAGGYEVAWMVEADPDWRMYFELLFPESLDFQLIQNRRQLIKFTSNGDQLSAERQVDHCATFEQLDEAQDASESLRDEGFEVGDPQASESGHWVVEFNRVERLDEGRPDAFCLEIIELLEPFTASYDGWGAAVVSVPTTH